MTTRPADLPEAHDPPWRLPLSEVMRPEIALVLQALRVLTVGDFLSCRLDPRRQRSIERAFDQPPAGEAGGGDLRDVAGGGGAAGLLGRARVVARGCE